ncbi:class I SAM-dependent methyltransferase [Nitriliruptor alkaliphilus]|uniref:class I SAM-dependent methyltransferase n=1 Tax=Nitriliruptor alkaliphilus TaxID=427918 RepID=UPI000698B946|nr:class I SAM-dependent methyltransferase [Nitriliruptor alkaliphilus]
MTVQTTPSLLEADLTATADRDAAELQAAVEALGERIFGGALASMELATVHLGLRLGIYQALQELGPATSEALAASVGLDERYLREWLEQQAVAEILTCANDGAAPEDRRYEVPAATAAVLLDVGTPAYLGPLAHLAVGIGVAVPAVEESFRAGGGVPFHAYGAEVRHGLGLLNGATFDRDLAAWIATMPDIDQRLRSGRRPAVLDLGCGVGRSTLALARAYPNAVIHGIDLDAASVEEARAAAAQAGLADRVTFAVADAAELSVAGEGRFDLVTVLEALHDMGDPVGALTSARRHLREGGAVLVADQLTRDAYAADGDPLERFQYGCSVLHCLPATRAEDHLVAHGTVIRAEHVTAWARDAGFPKVEILAIEDPFWRFYRL